MSDHHRSSYYKDSSYGSSSSKRYHSPAEAPRMGMSTGDYYDSESRSKRSRNDSYGTHTSSNRYADYSTSSGTSASGSRYKAASSASYYDLPGYKPSSTSSTSASASKYLEDYKGSSSSRSSAPKSNVRRVPPPLTPPTFSSKTSSASSIRLQPLMKVSLSSSSSAVGSSSTKDYYGSRMRQAPPEHHYSYSGSHSVSTHAKSDFKRTSTYGTSKTPSSAGYHSTSRVHAGSASYRSSATASRRLIARSRAPPPSSLNSRMRGRSSFANSRREDELRKRKVVSSKSDFKRSRSGSQSQADDRSVRTSTKEKKDVEENEKSHEKRQHEEEDVDYANVAEGQVVVEEVAGDDDEEGDQDDNCRTGEATTTTEKIEVDHKDDHHKDDQSVKSNVDESKAEDKNDADEGKSTEKGSEDQEKPAATRALLKLHCPYCDVRCISFREFTFHLRSSTHVRTMSSAVSEMKRKLTKVRQEMKEDQRKREKAEKVLSDTSSYCRVCELSFRTDPKEHEANEIHNKIKALIYRRCDVCDIDFRIWKVHIYHMAALEHAKRVAMKELQEGEAKGDNVKGTNLSPEELGLDLVEIRTVFYCNACIRYIPIKGQTDDAKKNHCMTLNHLKNVEEFNEKERRRAHREEARERAKRKKQEVSEKQEKRRDTTDAIDETDRVTTDVNEREKSADADSSSIIKNESGINNSIQIKQEPVDTYGEDGKTSKTVVDGQDSGVGGTSASENQEVEGQKNMNRNEADEEDDDEIELHAGEDDVEDESVDTGDWSRRTRAGQRGDGSSN